MNKLELYKTASALAEATLETNTNQQLDTLLVGESEKLKLNEKNYDLFKGYFFECRQRFFALKQG